MIPLMRNTVVAPNRLSIRDTLPLQHYSQLFRSCQMVALALRRINGRSTEIAQLA
jgi:hypothetical protein